MREDIKSIAEFIKKRFNPREILLFGSHGYGIPEKASDIDLLIIMDTDISVRD